MTNSVTWVHTVSELRKRLIYCVIAQCVIFAGLFYFANTIYLLLAHPLLKYLPLNQHMIATQVASSFFVPLELTFYVALFLGIPLFLYQLWAFVAPALYRHEKKLIWPLLLLSIVLFYLGVGFAYFIILPIIFKFLLQTIPAGILLSPDIASYLDFTLKLLGVFGLIFEVPMLVVLLIWIGLVTRAQLIRFRPYAIVSAFVLGMLLGPPDVISQTLFALPLWLLFEIGIFLARYFVKS